MNLSKIFAISMLSVASLFAVANLFNLSRTVTCFDCHFPYGVPFTFFQEGGFAGDAGFVWSGMAADGLVVLVCGIAVAAVWKWVSANRERRAASPR